MCEFAVACAFSSFSITADLSSFIHMLGQIELYSHCPVMRTIADKLQDLYACAALLFKLSFSLGFPLARTFCVHSVQGLSCLCRVHA